MTKIIIFLLLIAPVFAKAAPAAKNQTDVYRTIAGDLLKDCTGAGKAVAVAGFSYSDGRDSRDGGVVAERITTELVKSKKIKVIERKEIEKVFEELKLQRSGAINPDSAKEIGKMLGADWVVVGTLTELPDKQLELNTRLVSVESGEIITAANASLKKDWLDQYKKLLVEENKKIEKNSKDAKAFYERGRTNIDLAEYDSAIADFGIAIIINPTYMDAYFHRALTYVHARKYDKAIADFDIVIATNPTRTWVTYVARGVVYTELKEYDKAIADSSKAIEINPKNDMVYHWRGYAYFLKGEDDNAIEDFSKAVEINPKNSEAYRWRGNTYARKGEPDKAIADFSKAIEINPKNDMVYHGRGYAYFLKGEYDKAIEDSSKAIEINPKNDMAYHWRGYVYFRKEKYDNAIRDFSKAVEINPKNAEAYHWRGSSYGIMNKYDKALNDFNMTIKLKPELYSTMQALIEETKKMLTTE